MKKYRVILHNNKINQSLAGDSRVPEPWCLGMVAPQRESSRVRLARTVPKTGGWEMPWAKFLGLGVAVAGLVSGPLSGEAQASVPAHLALPQAERAACAWQSGVVCDASEAALQILEMPLGRDSEFGDMIQLAESAKDIHTNTNPGGHHSNTPTHTNSGSWDNHSNSSGHTNSGWDNHLNDTPGRGQFSHINSVGGDYIF